MMEGTQTDLLRETVFVFEEPLPAYVNLPAMERKRLCSLGPFNVDRLEYIKHLHYTIQPVESIQLTVSPRLDLPHYQASLPLPSGIPSRLLPAKEYCTHEASNFLYVTTQFNHDESRLLDCIGWEELGNMILTSKKDTSADISSSNRQRHYMDFGFTSNMSTSRAKNKLGISCPHVKHDSRDFTFHSPIIALATIISNRKFPFLMKLIDQNRANCFSRTIYSKNHYFEAWRVALTDNISLCGVHEDKNNDPAYPSVYVLSKIIKIDAKAWRISIIFYSRHSIGSYIHRRDKSYGPAISFVMGAYTSIHESRRIIKEDTFSLPKFVFSQFGTHCEEHLCHMKPSVNVSPIVHFTLVFIFQFELDYFEAISLVMAWAHMAYTPYFYCYAIQYLLKDLLVEEILHLKRGMVGLSILDFMRDLRHNHYQGRLIPGLKLSTTEDQVHIPTKQEWSLLVAETAKSFMSCFRDNSTLPRSKKASSKIYTALTKAITGTTRGANSSLLVHQLMAACSIIGLCPLWLYNECPITPTLKSMQYLQTRFGLPKGTVATDCFVKSLRACISNKTGYRCSGREIASIVCKSFQSNGFSELNSGDLFIHDLYYDGQCLFEVSAATNSVIIYVTSLEKRESVGPLLNLWLFPGKKQFLTIHQFLVEQNNEGLLDSPQMHPSSLQYCFTSTLGQDLISLPQMLSKK